MANVDLFFSVGLLPIERILHYCNNDAITCVDLSRLNKAWHARLAPWLHDTAPRAVRVQCAKLSALRTIYDARFNRFNCFSNACGAGQFSTVRWLFSKFPLLHTLSTDGNCWQYWCATASILAACRNGHLQVARWLHQQWSARSIYDHVGSQWVTGSKWASFRIISATCTGLTKMTLRDKIHLDGKFESTVGAWLDATCGQMRDYHALRLIDSSLLHLERCLLFLDCVTYDQHDEICVTHDQQGEILVYERCVQAAVAQADRLALHQHADSDDNLGDIADALERLQSFDWFDKPAFLSAAFRQSCQTGRLAASEHLWRRLAACFSTEQRQACIINMLRTVCKRNDERVIKWLLETLGNNLPPIDCRWFLSQALPACSVNVLQLIASAWRIDFAAMDRQDEHFWPRCVQSVVRNACMASHWTDTAVELERACAPIVWLERMFHRPLRTDDLPACLQTACSLHCSTVASWIFQRVTQYEASRSSNSVLLQKHARSIWRAALRGRALPFARADARGFFLTLDWMAGIFMCPFADYAFLATLHTKVRHNDYLLIALQFVHQRRGLTLNDARRVGLISTACEKFAKDMSLLQWLHSTFDLTYEDVHPHFSIIDGHMPMECEHWLQRLCDAKQIE